MHLFAAQSDGGLYSFSIQPESLVLENPRRVMLGSRAMKLYSLASADDYDSEKRVVFVASDQPTIIHSRNDRLFYSSVNQSEVWHVCVFPADVALASNEDGSTYLLIPRYARRFVLENANIPQTLYLPPQ